MDEGGLWRRLQSSPGELARARYLRGEIDERECARLLRVQSWVLAVAFPPLLLAAMCATRFLLHGVFYPRIVLVELAVLLIPLGPIFAWAVDRFVERPALRRAVERRQAHG